jgi:hypothetical protein
VITTLFFGSFSLLGALIVVVVAVAVAGFIPNRLLPIIKTQNKKQRLITHD